MSDLMKLMMAATVVIWLGIVSGLVYGCNVIREEGGVKASLIEAGKEVKSIYKEIEES